MDESPEDHLMGESADVFSRPSQSQYGFSGVFLLTNATDGPTAVPNLELDLVPEGLSLSKDDGTIVWTSTWEDIAYIDTPEWCRLPDNQEGVVLLVAPRYGRQHRFVIPAGNPAALEIALDAMADEFGVSVTSPQRSSVRVAASVISVIAVLAIFALLYASHVL